jgi:putative salt-induced outer membrane protein YdiY
MALGALLLAAPALADEVQFKNGDTITGTIVSTTGDQLTINSAVAGTITVKLSDVKTFSTDAPIALKFKDGTVINDKVKAAESGSVTTAGAGSVKSQDVALADLTAINPPPQTWTGDLTVGGIITRGNSDTEQLNVGFDATRRTDNDRIITHDQYLFGRTKDTTTGITTETTNNWTLNGEYDLFFNPKLYGYGVMGLKKDVIANLSILATPGAGIGYQWIERPTLNFDTEAGVGYLYQDYTNAGSTDYVDGRLAYHVDTKFNDKVSLFNDLEYLPSLENVKQYYVNEDAGVRVTLTAKMFAELKELWNYNSTPAPGSKKNDLQWVLSVGWLF